MVARPACKPLIPDVSSKYARRIAATLILMPRAHFRDLARLKLKFPEKLYSPFVPQATFQCSTARKFLQMQSVFRDLRWTTDRYALHCTAKIFLHHLYRWWKFYITNVTFNSIFIFDETLRTKLYLARIEEANTPVIRWKEPSASCLRELSFGFKFWLTRIRRI